MTGSKAIHPVGYVQSVYRLVCVVSPEELMQRKIYHPTEPLCRTDTDWKELINDPEYDMDSVWNVTTDELQMLNLDYLGFIDRSFSYFSFFVQEVQSDKSGHLDLVCVCSREELLQSSSTLSANE